MLLSTDFAAEFFGFIDHYLTYVINYSIGESLVRNGVESRAGTKPEKRWEIYKDLITTPYLPSDLAG